MPRLALGQRHGRHGGGGDKIRRVADPTNQHRRSVWHLSGDVGAGAETVERRADRAAGAGNAGDGVADAAFDALDDLPAGQRIAAVQREIGRLLPVFAAGEQKCGHAQRGDGEGTEGGSGHGDQALDQRSEA
jgi:hypothetical protein